MRILLVHNRYQQQGGEDAVFEAEANLLEQRGHDVTRLLFDNDDIPAHRTPLDSVRLGLTTVWSRLGVARVSQAIKECRPQVAHFHNTLPLVSPGAYSACRAAGVAVVQTLHNYRLICPSANLLRNNRPCEDCLRRTPPWPGVVHACYRGSRLQTSAIASMLSFHRLRGTWQQDVDLYIALSQFSKAKFVEFGIEPEQIVIKPNFVDDVNVIRRGNEDFFLFVGRLSKEKGIDLLLNAWVEERIEMPLHMVGDGPLESLVARTAKRYSTVHYLGRLSRTDVLSQMQAARALIFPSIWYEAFPVTLVEALACGLPIIASRLGVMPEVVADGQLGLLFSPGDKEDLAMKIRWAQNHSELLSRFGVEARREYETKYTPARNYEQLLAIYRHATDRARCRRGDR